MKIAGLNVPAFLDFLVIVVFASSCFYNLSTGFSDRDRCQLWFLQKEIQGPITGFQKNKP